jgi:2-oxoisovalerate dehydrogenase E1 component beta subunit
MSENSGFSDVQLSSDRTLTYLEAIAEGIRIEMERDSDVLILGEDIGGEFGGAFKVTKGLTALFGERRVVNTPVSELSFTGVATGMALLGLRPIIEMQFADFITSAFDSIVQFAATNHYRWGSPVPWVIRAPSDGGIRSGPFHSQNPEAWFVHTPGLKVLAPATPADAKGLLAAAVRDDNPVIYLEAKPLYRSERGYVPEGEHIVAIGSAAVVRKGHDITVIAYGSMVREALLAAQNLAIEGIETTVVDLRSLKPLDKATILEQAMSTGRIIITHAANELAGVGAEIAALIAREAFAYLDAPIVRICGQDAPIPFSPPLEDAYRPSADKIERAARELVGY